MSTDTRGVWVWSDNKQSFSPLKNDDDDDGGDEKLIVKHKLFQFYFTLKYPDWRMD